MKRKLPCLILAAVLALASLASCARRSAPPALEDIYDEVVSLVEASYAVNDVVFGHGLPVHAIGSEYAERVGLYRESDYADYEYVTDHSPYRSIAEIKEAMEAVYSEDYLASLYVGLFDGFATETGIVRAQYREDERGLCRSVDYTPLVTWQRIYDYASMRIVKPSSATYVTVELDSHLENETDVLPVRLALVLEDDGWRLDTPTY